MSWIKEQGLWRVPNLIFSEINGVSLGVNFLFLYIILDYCAYVSKKSSFSTQVKYALIKKKTAVFAHKKKGYSVVRNTICLFQYAWNKKNIKYYWIIKLWQQFPVQINS